jgi:hypothetical protein
VTGTPWNAVNALTKPRPVRPVRHDGESVWQDCAQVPSRWAQLVAAVDTGPAAASPNTSLSSHLSAASATPPTLRYHALSPVHRLNRQTYRKQTDLGIWLSRLACLTMGARTADARGVGYHPPTDRLGPGVPR